MEKRHSLLEESYSSIKATLERSDTMTVEKAQFGKVWLSHFMFSFYEIVMQHKTFI